MSMAIVGGAIIAGGAALGAAFINSEAAKQAANAQITASQKGIEESKKQLEEMQKLLAPYVQAGTESLTAQQALIGAKGPEEQKLAIQRIAEGQEFKALSAQGENAILQQAAATGGLRGGNAQASLAQFRPQLLSSLINQQYSRLGGLTQLGQSSAAGVGSAGMQTGANIADLIGQAGAARAGQAIATGQAFGQVPGAFIQGGLAGYAMSPSLLPVNTPSDNVVNPYASISGNKPQLEF